MFIVRRHHFFALTFVFILGCDSRGSGTTSQSCTDDVRCRAIDMGVNQRDESVDIGATQNNSETQDQGGSSQVDHADARDDQVVTDLCDEPQEPGRISAHRLNRVEYHHAVRDIFGLEETASTQFTLDPVVGGFRNNAS